MIRADIAIIGAGMAGASLAAELGGHASVVLVEAESQPGYHSTGRSAAFWSETYGGPAIQPLTTASGAYLRDHGFLGDREALHIGRAEDAAAIEAFRAEFEGSGVPIDPVDRSAVAARVRGLRPEWDRGLVEPTCADIDVAGLHAHYLGIARRAGVRLVSDAQVRGIDRVAGGWRLQLPDQSIETAVIVNAAGAWAGQVADMAGATPIAIQPMRRTIVQLRIDPPADPHLPLVIDIGERFYFKPDAGGRLWLSPHDETPVAPCDVAPEEIDVAIAIDRLEKAVDWRILHRERAWAGLRSFAPDRAPVYGFDPAAPGFFWFAGQGGFGIQTAPAAAMIGAALIRDLALPDAVSAIDVARYAPGRFA